MASYSTAACWQLPDGKMLTAPLPEGINGHFGPELRRFVLALHQQGQLTMPRLLTQLQRSASPSPIANQDSFVDKARDVLCAGLTSATWITADDTGARHKAANGFCTQIGNAQFTWFATTKSKSSCNLLDLTSYMAISHFRPIKTV